MTIKSCSDLQSTTAQDRQGQTQVIESFQVVVSNGLDSVVCETSKSVTALFKQGKPAVGTVACCNIKFRAVCSRDDASKVYLFATLMDYAPLT